MAEYEGNRRFVSNADQKRCKHCGLFVKAVKTDSDGLQRYVCDRCGPVLARE